jgi:8-hydroxy-5-deazaflavin:NADPH oxidoreductase
MKIGIIGAGNIGSVLALHFRRLRHTVLIANSRGPETLTQLAQKTGAIPVDISESARGVDLLVITIPMKSVPSLPKDLLSDLPSSSPVIDTGNYYPLRDGVITEIKAGMVESEWTSNVLGRPVVKAFNNIVADSLRHKGLPAGSQGRIALPVSGDDLKSKQLVMALLDQMGFDAIDVGPLFESWRGFVLSAQSTGKASTGPPCWPLRFIRASSILPMSITDVVSPGRRKGRPCWRRWLDFKIPSNSCRPRCFEQAEGAGGVFVVLHAV